MSKTWNELEKVQPKVLHMLSNSMKKDRISHAYLFEGLNGTGKKDISILLAKSIFCKNRIDDVKPCETCINCKRITNKNHPDVHIVEPDGASIKKHQIQSLQEEFSKTGLESNKKMYIIEHADRMTNNAANSLLKFLEEPNSSTVAILLTEQIHRILPTILSRCQILSFQPLSPIMIKSILTTNNVPEGLANTISELAYHQDEALYLSRDDWFAQARQVVIKLYEALSKKTMQILLFLESDWYSVFPEKERDKLSIGLDVFYLIVRDSLYIKVGNGQNIVFVDHRQTIEQNALQLSQKRIIKQMSAILKAKHQLSTNMNVTLLMEQMVIDMQEG